MSERTEHCRLSQGEAEELQVLLTAFDTAAHELRAFLDAVEGEWEMEFGKIEGMDIHVPSDASVRWHTLSRWRHALSTILRLAMTVDALGEVCDDAWVKNLLFGDDN
jgi:hypothetical protein